MPTKTPSTVSAKSSACSAIQPGSTSMPTALKNSVRSSVLSEDTSARTCTANGDSASKRPATNAPSAGDTPTACARTPEPRPETTATKSGSSRLARIDGVRRRRGTRKWKVT